MTGDQLLGFSSLVIAGIAMAIGAVSLRRRSKTDDFGAERQHMQAQIDGLERRTIRMDRELTECKEARDEFQRESEKLRLANFNLMSELYDLKRRFDRRDRDDDV